MQGDWEIKLHLNLSLQATRELDQLLLGLDGCQPNDNLQDKRLSSITHQDLSTQHFYNLLTFRGVCWEHFAFVWNTIIPLKHRIFLWLAFRRCLNTKDNMVRKHSTTISLATDCDICPATQTISHIILRCRPGHVLWDKLEVTHIANSAADIAEYVNHVSQNHASGHLWCALFASCVVSAWQARNDRTFNNKSWTLRFTCVNTAELLKLWSLRAR